jgi:hypothetical protein
MFAVHSFEVVIKEEVVDFIGGEQLRLLLDLLFILLGEIFCQETFMSGGVISEPAFHDTVLQGGRHPSAPGGGSVFCLNERVKHSTKFEELPHIVFFIDPLLPQQVFSVKEQTAVVIGLLKKHAHDEILIATDAGREGELIAREALMQAGIRDISRCRRFWVSEALTEPVIQAGIKAALPLSAYNKTGAQGFARQKADWLVGMNLSRYMSIGNTATFTVGRVQTAVLKAIADRNAEAARFIPQPYHELEARIQAAAGTVVTALLVIRLKNRKRPASPCPQAMPIWTALRCSSVPCGR